MFIGSVGGAEQSRMQPHVVYADLNGDEKVVTDCKLCAMYQCIVQHKISSADCLLVQGALDELLM